MQPAIATGRTGCWIAKRNQAGVRADDLPDQAIQDEVAKYLEHKLGEDLHKPYPERNERLAFCAQKS